MSSLTFSNYRYGIFQVVCMTRRLSFTLFVRNARWFIASIALFIDLIVDKGFHCEWCWNKKKLRLFLSKCFDFLFQTKKNRSFQVTHRIFWIKFFFIQLKIESKSTQKISISILIVEWRLTWHLDLWNNSISRYNIFQFEKSIKLLIVF